MKPSVVISIYDSKGDLWYPPQMFRNLGLAIRGWIDVCNDPQAMVSKHPADFTMFVIADFDEQTGKIVPRQTPESLGVAVQHIARAPVSSEPSLPFRKSLGAN